MPFLQAGTNRNYIRGILQACDMTSRYLCFAWLLKSCCWPECDCACCRWASLSSGTSVAASVLCVTLHDDRIYCNLTLLLLTCYLLRQRPYFFEKVVVAQLVNEFGASLWNLRTHYRVCGSSTNPSSESFVRHCVFFRVVCPSLNPVLSHRYMIDSSSYSSLLLWSQFWAIIQPLIQPLSHHSANCSESSPRN